jgi:hypothetical protein
MHGGLENREYNWSRGLRHLADVLLAVGLFLNSWDLNSEP